MTIIHSPNCENSSCVTEDENFVFNMNDLLSSVGKPGFELCRKLNGTPQIIEFQVDRIWYRLDRCSFDEKGFIDTDSLLAKYLKKPSREVDSIKSKKRK